MESVTIPEAVLTLLLSAAESAAEALGDELDLELGAGNEDFEDVQAMSASLDELSAAIEMARKAMNQD